MKIRDYQAEALDTIHRDLKTDKTVLLQAIMGAGKTVMVCRLIQKYFATTNRRFLILVHKKILIKQFIKSFGKFTEILPSEIGVCCAGMNQKKLSRRITIGTIQTFAGQNFSQYDLLIIDEVHQVSYGTGSQYDLTIKKLWQLNPSMRIIGLTATPYRLGHGYIYGDYCSGENLFKKINYQIGYKALIDSGHLMKLEGKVAENKTLVRDLETVSVSGDYVLQQLGQVMSRKIHLDTAVQGIQEYCQGFSRICVFCCTIDHAEKLAGLLGEDATTMHSQLPPLTQSMNMGLWKSGQKKIITSVNILVEGFDYPPLDCLVFARPTLSARLFVQGVGRVLRTHPGKDRAFLLDLTDNTARFGTDLDNVAVTIPYSVEVRIKQEREMEKICPNCEYFVHVARRQCPECGYEWPPSECEIATKLPKLSNVFFGEEAEPVEEKVARVLYFRHEKKGKPDSLRVEYHRGGIFDTRIASEWICLEHNGYARQKAVEWWVKKTDLPVPHTVGEALEEVERLITPDKILVKPEGKFKKVVKHVYEVPF